MAARFEPPPGAPSAPGAILASLHRHAVRARFVEGVSIGLVVGVAVAVRNRDAHDQLAIAVGAAALPIAILWTVALAPLSPARRISWNGAGITSSASGARTSILWRSARVWIARAANHAVLQVQDADGRVITCATGSAPAPWAHAPSTSRPDFDRLARAVEHLPPVGTPIEPRSGERPGLLVASVAAVVVLAFASKVGAPIASCVLAAVLALAIRPAVSELIAQLRAWPARRGARLHALRGGGSASLSVIRDDGSASVLHVAAVPADARIGERGEPVLARLEVHRDHAPYRGREAMHAASVESPGEGRARRRRLGSAVARIGIAIAGVVVGAWSMAAGAERDALIAASPPRSAIVSLVSPAPPPPPPPTAWPIAPRPPVARREVRRDCDARGECTPTYHYVDEGSVDLFACDTFSRARCDEHFLAAFPGATLREEMPPIAPSAPPPSSRHPSTPEEATWPPPGLRF